MCVWWGCAQGRMLETMQKNPKANELEKTKDQWFPPSMESKITLKNQMKAMDFSRKKKVHI